MQQLLRSTHRRRIAHFPAPSNSAALCQNPTRPTRLFAHDEGACWAPAEIYQNSIILTHHAPLAPLASSPPAPPPAHPVVSGTTRPGFNFTAAAAADPALAALGVGRHRCYDPAKDIALPAFRRPAEYHAAPALGAPADRRRDILLLLRADMGGARPAAFSGGARQEVLAAARAGQWAARYAVKLGGPDEIRVGGV